MTDHAFRLYAGATALLAFFLVWAVVAARPWADAGRGGPAAWWRSSAASTSLKREAQRVNRVVERRFATYRRRLARREREIAAARAAAPAAPAGAPAASAAAAAPSAPPPVAVSAAPPVTATGSS